MTLNPGNLAGTAVETFDDEFNSLSLWNGRTGTWASQWWYLNAKESGYYAGGGSQTFFVNTQSNVLPSPFTDSNGVLTITAQQTPANLLADTGGNTWMSGELNTYHSFSQTYGYFEMRAELPAGQGFWPAFWLLPEDGSWPPELDVMEQLGNNPTTIYTTEHSNFGNVATQDSIASTVTNTSTGFHTYGVDWEPDHITWYVDGQEVAQVATPADMNKPMFMVLNLSVGGAWGGNSDATTPATGQMKIDYIHVYSAMPGSGSPTSTVSGTQTTQATTLAGATTQATTSTSTSPYAAVTQYLDAQAVPFITSTLAAAGVTAIDKTVTKGSLSATSFETNLERDITPFQLGPHQAVLFTPSSGTLAGQTFLVIEEAGKGGYVTNVDQVINLTAAGYLSHPVH